MRHVVSLIIKFALTFVVLFLVMNVMNNYPVWPIVGLSFLLTGLAYLVGDLAILPMTNNTTATLADFGLAALTIWLLGPFFVDGRVPFGVAFLSALFIAIGEWFFHRYLDEAVFEKKGAQD